MEPVIRRVFSSRNETDKRMSLTDMLLEPFSGLAVGVDE